MTNFKNKVETVHEALGVFDNADNLQAAINDLQQHGFMRQELSVLADDKAVMEKLGHIYSHVEDAKHAAAAPRTVFVANETIGEAEGVAIGIPLYVAAITATGVVVASGGTILSAIIAASVAGAAGATIGSIFASFIAKHHADYIQEQLDKGGLLLWVHLSTPNMEKTATDILTKNQAHNVNIHKIPLHA